MRFAFVRGSFLLCPTAISSQLPLTPTDDYPAFPVIVFLIILAYNLAAMAYQPILSTLGYILSPDRKRVLMVKRNARPTDIQFGKYNGLGGRVERDEDIASAMQREIREESGLECLQMRLRGTINWTGFGPQGEDWFGFVFLIEEFCGVPAKSNEEGSLEWIALTEIMTLPMWEGDRHFLPLIFDNDPRIFHAFLPYADGKPQGWQCRRI